MFYVSLKNQQIKVRNIGRMDAHFVTVQCGQIQFMLKELASRYAVHFSVTDNVPYSRGTRCCREKCHYTRV